MANIRIDLDAPLYDGQEVTFKAPCDSTDITGLIIYHPEGDSTVSTVFTLKDAHGNNLDTIDLFGEGAYLTVILDTVNCFTYFKNADTNAYLERRFEEIQNSVFIRHTEIVVPTSAWVTDTTFADASYPYKAEITIVGLTEDYSSVVIFSPKDADSGLFATVTDTGEDFVAIYAKSIPTEDITILSIESHTAVSGGTTEEDYTVATNAEVNDMIDDVYGDGSSENAGGTDVDTETTEEIATDDEVQAVIDSVFN